MADSKLGLSPGYRLLVGERVLSYTTITLGLSLASLVLTQPRPTPFTGGRHVKQVL